MNVSDAGDLSTTRGSSPISHAVAILRCFSEDQPLLGVTDIAARMGLHKSSASRILSTLDAEGLVERDGLTRKYRLGIGLIALAGPLLADLDERRAARPVLRELTDDTGETSALFFWHKNAAVCVEQIPSTHLVKHTAFLGTRYATALSSSVQVFLAAQTPRSVNALLRQGQVEHPKGPDADFEAYFAELTAVRHRGYAINDRGTSAEEIGVAAPVFDHRGEVVAAVLVAAPSFRVAPKSLVPLAKRCAEAALQVTRRLGGCPPVEKSF